ncbi:MAG: Uma2 family endonuclease [Actinomycetota bacterium]|nr:Uma2 family endonuclease [Actinomycetota bacterium]
MASILPRHAFTVEEWEQMGRIGMFNEDARLELIDGEIVDMTPIGARHQYCVKRLNRLFGQLLGEGAVVSVQDPLRLGGRSEPQPDIALLRPPLERYRSVPTAPDALLVVEVADSSLERDLAKTPIYARAGVLECWVVDLEGPRILTFAGPGPDGYGLAAERRGDDLLSIASLPQLSLTVSQLLGDVAISH